MPDDIRNRGASVRARLLKLSKERTQPFDILLTRYVLERLLHRLGTASYKDRFALKGAMLLTVWFTDPHRQTRDVDLLGFGDPTPEAVLAIFREVCVIALDDGVVFDVDKLELDRTREELEYGGLRIKTFASVGGAKVRVVVNIGFGDATEPGLTDTDLPVLLDRPPLRMRAYARETVIAEKFQAMVMLGHGNTRMKDFYDILMLSRSYEFPGDALARAIAATFARRKTEIPASPPDALTDDFASDSAKVQQWESFLLNVAVHPGPLADVVKDLAKFLMLHAEAARTRS
ncbi:MAG: nucleotidyl transferase AbiEii/AbiGii toxin family protein [Acidobacteriota bacterium]